MLLLHGQIYKKVFYAPSRRGTLAEGDVRVRLQENGCEILELVLGQLALGAKKHLLYLYVLQQG